MAFSAESAEVFRGGGVSGGEALLLYKNGTASGQFAGQAQRLVMRARGDLCAGSPRMSVSVDGRQVAAWRVNSESWKRYGANVNIRRGDHRLAVTYADDLYKSRRCDRNLRLDTVSVIRPFSQPAPADPAPTEPAPMEPTPGDTAPGVSPSGDPSSGYVFGLIGNDGTHLPEERDAGVGAKILRLSWRDYYPQEGQKNTGYVEAKKAELRKLRGTGFEVILGLNYHDVPAWVHANYPDSYYVNQFGESYAASGNHDMGDANLVFNPQMRELVDEYVGEVFADLGTDFYGVRVGGGRLGELTYPPASYGGRTNLYWAYDENAAHQNPAPGWEPGDPSPNGEARKFVDWYLDELVDYQNWQIEAVRRAGYRERIMVLYPSWGLRSGQVDQAVNGRLSGSTPAEKNGELQRGFDFARQVRAISDPKAVVTTTWIDAPAEWSSPANPTPVEYLSTLAKKHEPALEVYGENTGAGSRAKMEFSVSQMRRYDLLGMAWFNEAELFSGKYATLEDYRRTIAASQE